MDKDMVCRQDAIYEIANKKDMSPKDRITAVEVLDGLPPAQPEIILCEGCKYWNEKMFLIGNTNGYCSYIGLFSENDFYCARAVRRKE